MDENSISKLIQLTQENNEMLKKITTFIEIFFLYLYWDR